MMCLQVIGSTRNNTFVSISGHDMSSPRIPLIFSIKNALLCFSMDIIRIARPFIFYRKFPGLSPTSFSFQRTRPTISLPTFRRRRWKTTYFTCNKYCMRGLNCFVNSEQYAFPLTKCSMVLAKCHGGCSVRIKRLQAASKKFIKKTFTCFRTEIDQGKLSTILAVLEWMSH